VEFEVIGEIRGVETIASGRGIHIYSRLVRDFGRGNWRKKKGFASVRLANGKVREVEIHWYESHGIGKRKLKIKRYIDQA